VAEKQRVRIGFVGVGGMGQAAHLRNYMAIPDECDVVAIAEVREKTGAAVARKFGIEKVYPSHEELVANEDVDAFVCSQPFTRHGILVPELLKAGKPVFTEKPLAGSIHQGERIVEAEKLSPGWVMVGYHKRSDPATMYAKAEVERLKASGEWGRLRYVRSHMPPGDWVAGGFWDMVNAGDPAPELAFEPPAPDMDEKARELSFFFVNYYIHQVNLLRHFLGEPYRVTYADAAGVLFVGASESGVTCALEMAPYETSIEWYESLLVAFERGYVRVELPAPMAMNRPGKVTLFADPGEGATPMRTEPTLPWVHAMKQQAINYCQAVRGEVPPMTTAAEALEDLRVARDYIRLWKGV
jgi:predicted dehydrogenase